MLYFLILIPVMATFFIFTMTWKRKARLAYAGSRHLDRLIPGISRRKDVIRFILFSAAVFFIILALANPQLGTKLEEVKRQGIDIVIALDVSNSMKAEDYKPNRLELARRAIEKLIEGLKSDRIGIVVFAGDAYIQLPVTTDYSAARLYATSITTEMVPTQGTAIGAAIRKSIAALSHDETRNRAIIVISDGENHQDDATDAATEAAQSGISVHTIGMGSPQGAPIPIYRNNQNIGFRTDKNGNTVVSRLDEEGLKKVAAAGNGIYVRAGSTQAGLNIIQSELEKMEKTEYEARQYTDFEDRFQLFLLAALILLLLDFLLSERKSRWVEKLKLFNI